jgi:hypothetical protein
VKPALKRRSLRMPRYSPLVYVIRLTEELQTVSYVCIRTRSGEVDAGGCYACTAAKRVLQRFNGAAAFNRESLRRWWVRSVPNCRNKGSFGTKVPFALDISSLLGAGTQGAS